MSFHIFVQARMGSSRFPGKVLKNIEESKSVLDLVFERISHSKGEPHLITSIEKKDDVLEKWAKEKDIKFFRGQKKCPQRFFEAGNFSIVKIYAELQQIAH